jgi:hypothetical protein
MDLPVIMFLLGLSLTAVSLLLVSVSCWIASERTFKLTMGGAGGALIAALCTFTVACTSISGAI